MKICLKVAEGVRKGLIIPLDDAEFVIGRDPSCHLRPSSIGVSRRHCLFRLDGDRLFIRDLGSSNGTYVNGHPIHDELELHADDAIQVGPLRFLVHVEETVELLECQTTKEASDSFIAALLLESDDELEAMPFGAPPVPLDETLKGDKIETVRNPPTPAVPTDKPAPRRSGGGPVKHDSVTVSAAAAILDAYKAKMKKK
jgi:pSer/pThr/pTyr-binding forkhead associated (FHA) protein